MKFEEFLQKLKCDYSVVKILSDRNNTEVILLKHRTLEQRMVLRFQEKDPEIYRFLKDITFENLPKIYDIYSLDDGFAVLEEYIDGMSVADVLECGPYNYHGAKKVISDICDALQVLHGNGYVHRDIKPENIMISSSGTVKLIDFNISRSVKLNKKCDTQMLGTLGYASPEQLGISQSDPRTDIYAIGVLLNIMLTQKHPGEELARGKAGRIIMKCTRISPEQRYQNVKELKKGL